MEAYMNELFKVVLEAILVLGILSYFFLKREERLKKTIEEEFKKYHFFNTQLNTN